MRTDEIAAEQPEHPGDSLDAEHEEGDAHGRPRMHDEVDDRHPRDETGDAGVDAEFHHERPLQEAAHPLPNGCSGAGHRFDAHFPTASVDSPTGRASSAAISSRNRAAIAR